jgi:C-terminal processing protease CtpA/Prc
VKQRKVEEQNQQLIQELQQERSRRRLLQLDWASLENTLKLSFPVLSDALSLVASRMVVAEDHGFSLFLDQTHVQTGEYVVSYVLPDSPAAEQEKIQPGDIVRDINGVSLHGKTVAEVDKMLIVTKPDSTVSMLVFQAQDASLEPNLVIIERPKLVPSPSPPLTQARRSLLDPDPTDLIATGELSASIAVDSSFEVY